MTDEEPLDVRVARALGWTDFDKDGYYTAHPPYYSTDWSATGPLIEKYRISVIAIPTSIVYGGKEDPFTAWNAYNANGSAGGLHPLIAVCKLILALGKAGKL